MNSPRRIEKTISIDRVFLHHENPRHEPYESQSQVIEYLCRHEDVYQLARDIVKHGVNPLERFAVFRDEDSDDDDAVYIIAEGNRRVCAIKLLSDPDLAPPSRRKEFERIGRDWSGIYELPSIVFEDRDDLNLWLERTHHGPQGGIGRKDWNAVQKQRHSGSSKNRIALAILDYAEANKFISSQGRKENLQPFRGTSEIRWCARQSGLT